MRSTTAAAFAGFFSLAFSSIVAAGPDERHDDGAELHRNPSGAALTLSSTGRIDRRNPFFASLGTNGRSCESCHQAAEGWTITPRGLRDRFEASGGRDPVFRLVDGANSPKADVSTREAREKAYSMLLRHGVIRIGLPIPANSEFELVKVEDPYGYASAAELSLFRRPLAATNIRFLSTVMWDGRETFKDPASTDCISGTTTCFATLHFDLADQANSAVTKHAQGMQPLTTAQAEAIIAFESSLTTAQVRDDDAGNLTVHGAHGGPSFLQGQVNYFGINDTLAGDYRTHANFTPDVMSLYTGWQSYIFDARRPDQEGRSREVAVARRAVARGEALFNSKPISITGVKGLNDDLHLPVIAGTCTTCHNAPNAGNHSVPLPLDLGLADASRRSPDQPLYTLRNKTSGETVQTTDPGRALVTGKWQDIGKFKGPTLRALAARAPYFHNAFAKGLPDVVDFYNDRFGIGFTQQEKDDLVAFLKTL
ncbi:cytochrome C [Scleromatobacter humisilvae]|uniref:Cytochrome C n=1 Tax=Scleromatobacter humisilvae TaxID=2897159 RepID=A0A9X1YIQ8_9BURK|nr:cytochrome C [Scleromatobacter humisilvae]MCK9685453.1 cytochrome C [Scleromatobacter humisilvae]